MQVRAETQTGADISTTTIVIEMTILLSIGN
jgi:hypothetical protein